MLFNPMDQKAKESPSHNHTILICEPTSWL